MKQELSYFKEALLAFLEENHPELFHNKKLVQQRVEQAKTAYVESIHEGFDHIEAEAIASYSLYNGLHFSKFNTIRAVLAGEFENEFQPDQYETLANKLLPECESIFDNFNIDDDFAYTPEFDILYTQLTGTILIWLENEF